MRRRLWAARPVLVLLDGGVLCPESGASQRGLPGTTVGGPGGAGRAVGARWWCPGGCGGVDAERESEGFSRYKVNGQMFE